VLLQFAALVHAPSALLTHVTVAARADVGATTADNPIATHPADAVAAANRRRRARRVPLSPTIDFT
jgi:hypothetical protein